MRTAALIRIVSANGMATLARGWFAIIITFGAGSSFAAPSVAGVAALLRQAVPGATARQVRNAIISTRIPQSSPTAPGVLDYAPLVDALAARNLLAGGHVRIPSPLLAANSSVEANIEKNTTLNVRSGFVRQSFSNLSPANAPEIL